MEDYKIELGVGLDEKQLNTVRTTINNLVDKERKINLDIDFNIKNASKLADVGKEIEAIKSQLKELDNVGSMGKSKSPISINSKSLETSLGKIHDSIKKLQNAFGRVDDNKGVQSLLTTVNKIRKALEGVASQFEGLNKSLTTLSNKDFNLNFDLSFGTAKKDPAQLMKELKVLEKEAREYENYFYKVLNKTNKLDETKARDSIYDLANRVGKSNYQNYLIGLDTTIANGTDSSKIAAYKEYIRVIKELASLGNYSIAPVETKLAESGDFIKVKNEANETKEALKELFSGGINADKLHQTINNIATDLGEIKKALQEFSNIKPFEGLTQSLAKLDGTLDKLLSNVNAVKKVVDAGLSITSPTDVSNGNQVDASLENTESDLKQVTVAASDTVKAIQQMRDTMKSMNFDHSSIEAVAKDLEDLGIQISKISVKDNVTKLNVTVEGVDSIGRTVTEIRQLDKASNNISLVSTTFTQSFKEADSFIKQQKKSVADLTNQINQLNRAAKDQNASRPIKGDKHLDTLQTKYNEITTAIKTMGAASSDTFVDAQNDVRKLISEFKSLVSEYKNAENVALQMDGNDFDSGKRIAENNLGKLKKQAKDFAAMQATIDKLDKKFASVGDVSSLKEFNNELRVARSELAKVKAETASANRAQKNADFNKLKSLSEQIKHLNFQIDISEDAAEIKKLVNQLNELESEYNELYAVTSKKLSSDQIAELNPIENLNKEFAEFIKLQEEIGRKKVNIRLLESQGAEVGYIQTLKKELEELEITSNRVMSSFWKKVRNNADIVTTDDEARFNNQIAVVTQGIEHKLNNIDANTIKSINKEMASFVKLREQINKKQAKINALTYEGGNQNYIVELNKELEELENNYSRLMHTFMKKLTANADILPMDDIKNFDNEIQNTENVLRELDAKIADTKSKLASDIKLDFGTFETEVLSLENNIGKLSNKSADLVTGVELLKKHLTSMKNASDDDELIASAEKYKLQLKEVENQLKQNQIAEQKANDVARLKQEKEKFSLQMGNWLKDNSAAAKDFGGRIRELQAQIDACDSKQLNGLKREFQIIKQEAKEAGKTTQTLGDKLKTQFSKYSAYFGVAEIFMYAEQGLRDMFEQVKLIDSAMTELKKVTNETDAAYNNFLSNAARRSKELGTTIDGLVSSTADFARLGYGFKDAQGLAEVANIYAVVGDEINGVEGATESLISTMAAFKDEMNGMSNSDFAMSIVDKFNEIGNNFAISSGGIGEALERSASSLMAANNTIDESIALITAANTVVQDPEAVGEWLADIKSGYIG